jgi:hypothetical protein
MFTPSRINWVWSVNKIYRWKCGNVTNQWQHSNSLLKSEGPRQWICWEWYNHRLSKFNDRRPFVRGTLRRAALCRVLSRGLRCTITIILSSSTTAHLTACSPADGILEKYPFLAIVDCQYKTRLSGIHHLGRESSSISITSSKYISLKISTDKCVYA